MDELRALLNRHAQPDSSTAIEGLLISKVDSDGSAETSMTGTVFALIAQGQKRLALGDRVFDYGVGQYLVASVDLPVTGHFVGATPQTPALGVGLQLDPAAIARLLLDAGPGVLPRESGGPVSALAVSDAGGSLLDAVLRLVRLLDEPRDRATLAPLVVNEILWRLITGEQGAAVRQLGLADSTVVHVSRAVRWIRDNYAESFRVEEVAEISGMSVSAFHRNFQAVTAMSPIQFQKQIRLQEARLLLATHPGEVASVGHRVGYDSASQFSREYRRQFGAPPSLDAAELRRRIHAAPALP